MPMLEWVACFVSLQTVPSKQLSCMSEVIEQAYVTVHVGMYQNIEIEIFAEYKYTLNELPVKKYFQ